MPFGTNYTSIFDKYHATLVSMLRELKPRITSDDEEYHEHNLAAYFAEAVKAYYPNAIVCYEYPWHGSANKYRRFYGIIYIPEEKEMLIIESKCIRKWEKVAAMFYDLARIYDNAKSAFSKHNPELEIEKYYAVILTDYWGKGGYINDFDGGWGKPRFDYAEDIVRKHTTSPSIIISITKVAKKISALIATGKLSEWINSGNKKPDLGNDYYLLSFISEI